MYIWCCHLILIEKQIRDSPINASENWRPDALFNTKVRKGGYKGMQLVNPIMIKDANGRPFIFDAFVREGILYLVSTYYHLDESPVIICVGGEKMNETGSNDRHNQMRFFKLHVGDNLPSEITINGVQHPLQPYIYTPSSRERSGVAIATLFKNDHAVVKDTIRWYKSQGVTHFYLYYNGSTLPEGLPQEEGVVYGLWPFSYTNYEGTHDIRRGWLFTAQPTFLTMIRLKYFPDHIWMGLIDLDEHIYPLSSGNRIADVLASHSDADVVMVKNHWSKRDGDRIQYSLKSSGGYGDRTKCFYNKSFTGYWGVHVPKTASKVIQTDRMIMAHVVNYLHPERIHQVQPPYGEFTLPPASV
jgi:hypothetical protein